MIYTAYRLLITLSGIFLAGILLFSCTGREQRKTAQGTTGKDPETSLAAGEVAEPTPDAENAGQSILAADKIVYDVEIINPYPDDLWTTECLESLDHEALVDFVFTGIYSGEFSAFDIFEGTAIPARRIKKMEENGEFSRDRIGKFQFQEEWALDMETMSFTKKVTEIRMGLQKFNEAGELTGYAPLLRVVL